MVLYKRFSNIHTKCSQFHFRQQCTNVKQTYTQPAGYVKPISQLLSSGGTWSKLGKFYHHC